MASTVIESDGFTLLSQPVATYGPFRLVGGTYLVDVNSSGAGTATVVKNMADGTTVAMTSALAGTSPGSHTSTNLGPGMYSVTVAVAACDVGVNKIRYT